MDNCILLSIRKNWAAAILSGEKRLEIRKCAPSYNPNTEKRAEYAFNLPPNLSPARKGLLYPRNRANHKFE